MFGEVWRWCLAGIVRCFGVMRTFILDETVGLTFFHFAIFTVFIRTLIFVMEFVKQFNTVNSETDQQIKKERGYKK